MQHKRSPRYQSGAEHAGEGALTYANAISFFAPELSLQRMTEAPNMALHMQSPYTKNRDPKAAALFKFEQVDYLTATICILVPTRTRYVPLFGTAIAWEALWIMPEAMTLPCRLNTV